MQACDGTIAQLRQYLSQMNASNAVNILDNALAGLDGGERLKSAPLLGGRTVLDSGIESQSTGSSEMSECTCSVYVHACRRSTIYNYCS